jgi:hypothetical protein
MSVPSRLGEREASFTPADLKLFYQSPFASWMEQLDREFPDHGFVPDLVAEGVGTEDEVSPAHNQAFLRQLVGHGNRVVSVSEEGSGSERQLQTLNAMRSGVNFIFNPFLSAPPLEGCTDFLLRSAGRSLLGDYHYTPAEFYYADPEHDVLPVQLCCMVDLLENIQTTRPAEVLRVCPTDATNPRIDRLLTQEFMFDYRKLKIRYRQARVAFDPSQTPNPQESKHWGRWSRCARKLLGQRAHGRG